jgi:branched-subunit amino acid ABC-type transport system permease component
MIFGVMNIANFAHGEFYMLGGFLAFYLVSLMGLGYFLALPAAVAWSSRWRSFCSTASSGGCATRR